MISNIPWTHFVKECLAKLGADLIRISDLPPETGINELHKWILDLNDMALYLNFRKAVDNYATGRIKGDLK